MSPRQNNNWKPLVLALAAYMFVPAIPYIKTMIPVEQTLLLLIPVIAVCAIIGWLNGGNAVLAAVWLVLAVLTCYTKFSSHPTTPSAQAWMERGWAVLLAASFGVVCIFLPKRPFFARALATIGLAAFIGFVVILSNPHGLDRVTAVVEAELDRRAVKTVTDWQQVKADKNWRKMSPSMEENMLKVEAQLLAMPEKFAPLAPALLALESILALALGWTLYHKLFQAPIGKKIGRLKDFRFNDQLVWGVAVGATLYLLPSFEDGKGAGLNLLIFFGTLFLFRGLGVLAWMTDVSGLSRQKGMFIATTVVVCLFAWPVLGVIALGLGLGDTWMDWRNRSVYKKEI